MGLWLEVLQLDMGKSEMFHNLQNYTTIPGLSANFFGDRGHFDPSAADGP